MPVYSFHKGPGAGFLMSLGKARNRITTPVGTGPLGYIGTAMGFAAVNQNNVSVWDFEKWYPIGLFRLEWTKLGVTKVNQYKITFPKYYNDPNLTWEGVIQIEMSEFSATGFAGDIFFGDLARTQFESTDSIRTEWRTTGFTVDGPPGTLKYKETYQWLDSPTYPERTWDRMVNEVNAAIDSATRFGDSWYLTDTGRAGPLRLAPPNVHWTTRTNITMPGSFPTTQLPTFIHGIKPFVINQAQRKKYRYRSTLSATDVHTKQTFGGSPGPIPDPITLISESALPNGIDVASPRQIPIDHWREYPLLHTASSNHWGITYRRAIVPPDTRPPGV